MKPENERKVEAMKAKINGHLEEHKAGIECKAECPISTDEGAKKMVDLFISDLERGERVV